MNETQEQTASKDIQTRYAFEFIEAIDLNKRFQFRPSVFIKTHSPDGFIFGSHRDARFTYSGSGFDSEEPFSLFPAFGGVCAGECLYIYDAGEGVIKRFGFSQGRLDGAAPQHIYGCGGKRLVRMVVEKNTVYLCSDSHKDYVKEHGFMLAKIEGNEINVLYEQVEGFRPIGLMAGGQYIYVYNSEDHQYYKFNKNNGERLEPFALEASPNSESSIAAVCDDHGSFYLIDPENLFYKYSNAGRLIYRSNKLTEISRANGGFQTPLLYDKGVVYGLDIRLGQMIVIRVENEPGTGAQ